MTDDLKHKPSMSNAKYKRMQSKNKKKEKELEEQRLQEAELQNDQETIIWIDVLIGKEGGVGDHHW